MGQKYYFLEDLIDMVDPPNRKCCYNLLDDNKKLIYSAPGSRNNHQAWEGGYKNHLLETMNIAVILYDSLSRCRPLPFTLSDSLLVLFLHDLEKPWRYVKNEDGWRINPDLQDKVTQVRPFVERKINEYFFQLSKEHWNGIEYVEGEKRDYSGEKRVQGPLAAFCHLCDTTSARIWFDNPLPGTDDLWLFGYKIKKE